MNDKLVNRLNKLALEHQIDLHKTEGLYGYTKMLLTYQAGYKKAQEDASVLVAALDKIVNTDAETAANFPYAHMTNTYNLAKKALTTYKETLGE